MLTIDDNMFKLIKMQESLLKVATGDRSYHLSNYVKNVMMIDKKLFDELVDIMKGTSEYNQTLEEELVHLEKVKSAYNQVLEFQMRFRNVCESYGKDDLELSDMSLLNIKYIDERISVINGYLTNIKNIEENKDKLEELNDKLVNEEKKREFLEKKIELFEKKLREDFIYASLKQVVFGKLESYDIIFEYSKLGYDAVRLLDNPLELDNKYRNIDIQASEITEKYEAARLCYNNLFDNDSKNILSEIEKEFYLIKYKYIMLKLLKLLVSEANTCELAKVKRENFVELINSRSKCLEKLKINNPLNILSAVDMEGQMNEINELSVCIKSIHDTRKKISELSSRTESMINENNSYLISLSDTKELIRSKVSFKDVDITTFDDMNLEMVKKKATPSENQVVGVKSVSSLFKLIISKQKANSVITRICSMYLKEDEKTRTASADLVEETPELVIVSEKEEIRDDVSHVEEATVISKKTKIPIYEILKDNKTLITKIKKTLTKSIIGQEKAIDELINITKRIKLGYKENKCTSLLFTGKSGVGKTQLATIYAKIISNSKLIKIDMSEFSDSTSVNKFLGSNAGYVGYDDNKHVLSIIKDNPNSVILFDEIDKAHPKIINLLYQMLDESCIKDSKNNLIKLNNNIIIMTTNKGTESTEIGFIKENKLKTEELRETFNIALLNRIDNIINFNQLSKSDITKIINHHIDKLKTKYKNYEIINELIELSEYQTYGARKIEKIINNKIENIIIDMILENNRTINIDSILTK